MSYPSIGAITIFTRKKIHTGVHNIVCVRKTEQEQCTDHTHTHTRARQRGSSIGRSTIQVDTQKYNSLQTFVTNLPPMKNDSFFFRGFECYMRFCFANLNLENLTHYYTYVLYDEKKSVHELFRHSYIIRSSNKVLYEPKLHFRHLLRTIHF